MLSFVEKISGSQYVHKICLRSVQRFYVSDEQTQLPHKELYVRRKKCLNFKMWDPHNIIL